MKTQEQTSTRLLHFKRETNASIKVTSATGRFDLTGRDGNHRANFFCDNFVVATD